MSLTLSVWSELHLLFYIIKDLTSILAKICNSSFISFSQWKKCVWSDIENVLNSALSKSLY